MAELYALTLRGHARFARRREMSGRSRDFGRNGCAIPFRENLQEISKYVTDGLQVGFKPRISSAAIHGLEQRSSYWYRSTY
jgi:hypothetical protein